VLTPTIEDRSMRRPRSLPQYSSVGKRDRASDHVLAMHWLACRVTVADDRGERDIRVSVPLARALLKPHVDRAAKRREAAA
jgi:hypothetical protein